MKALTELQKELILQAVKKEIEFLNAENLRLNRDFYKEDIKDLQLAKIELRK